MLVLTVCHYLTLFWNISIATLPRSSKRTIKLDDSKKVSEFCSHYECLKCSTSASTQDVSHFLETPLQLCRWFPDQAVQDSACVYPTLAMKQLAWGIEKWCSFLTLGGYYFKNNGYRLANLWRMRKKNWCHHMSVFKAKMHHIVSPGARPRPRWGSL